VRNVPELIPDPEDRFDRFKRFERLFRAQDTLGDFVNEILINHESQLKIREGDEHDLSLLISLSFGKGMKTFLFDPDQCRAHRGRVSRGRGGATGPRGSPNRRPDNESQDARRVPA
jgi:hypothetical protein